MRWRVSWASGWLHRGQELLARIWRQGAGWQLAALFVFGSYVVFRNAPGPGLVERLVANAVIAAIYALLLWGVWAGGSVARGLVIYVFVGGYLKTAESLAQRWDAAVLADLASWLAALALLVSPAIWARMQRPDPPHPARVLDFERIRPPSSILPWSLLIGLGATLLYYAHVSHGPAPGCGSADVPLGRLPMGCVVVLHGYPLPLIMHSLRGQGIFLVLGMNLVKDWAQWALLAFSVLYLFWWRREPPLGIAASPSSGLASPAPAGPAGMPDSGQGSAQQPG